MASADPAELELRLRAVFAELADILQTMADNCDGDLHRALIEELDLVHGTQRSRWPLH